MIYNLVRKGGIPVLASPASNTASQLSCCLAIKFLEARMQATISLQCSFPIHGFDDEQTFTLMYTADNMVPGNTSLKPPAASPPQNRLHEIARQGNVHLKTLSLALKAPCPVWCPPSSGPIAPKDGFSATFGQFAELASATQIHILFDWNWLHKDHHARFDLLIRHPEQLTGIPVDQSSANRYRLADWSVFTLVDDVASEAPPPYTVASKKRPRPAAANSTPPLPPKRVLLSPTPFLTSPTEKATPTSVSVPSPKTPLFPAPTSSSEFQDAVKNVVETLLPQMLQTILPNMLPLLSTTPSPSPSPSRSPLSSQVKAKPISSLGTFLNARATARLEAQLREIYAETLDHATEMHNAADVEFHEILEEQKLDVAVLKEDSIAELNRVFDDKLAEFRESTADMVDEMEKRVELVYADVRERLDVLVNEYPKCEGGLEKKKRVPGEQRQNIVESRSRRAASLPL